MTLRFAWRKRILHVLSPFCTRCTAELWVKKRCPTSESIQSLLGQRMIAIVTAFKLVSFSTG
jgi:hypothetical protein